MTAAIDTNALSNLGLNVRQTREAKTEMGQKDFLTLMTAQLKHQDPFKPMENGEFLGQIAQFSTVSGIEALNKSFSSLSSSLQSNQALQAAQLVGHGVLVPAKTATVATGEVMTGAADLPASGRGVVEVLDSAGQVVRTMDLGTQPAGLSYFQWDGLDNSGNATPTGRYQFRARVETGTSSQSADMLLVGGVSSVSLGSNGIQLNLPGMDPVSFSAVRQIL